MSAARQYVGAIWEDVLKIYSSESVKSEDVFRVIAEFISRKSNSQFEQLGVLGVLGQEKCPFLFNKGKQNMLVY